MVVQANPVAVKTHCDEAYANGEITVARIIINGGMPKQGYCVRFISAQDMVDDDVVYAVAYTVRDVVYLAVNVNALPRHFADIYINAPPRREQLTDFCMFSHLDIV